MGLYGKDGKKVAGLYDATGKKIQGLYASGIGGTKLIYRGVPALQEVWEYDLNNTVFKELIPTESGKIFVYRKGFNPSIIRLDSKGIPDLTMNVDYSPSVDSMGNIYVVKDHKLVAYDSLGNLRWSAADAYVRFKYGYVSITIDQKDNIIAYASDGKLYKYSNSGHLINTSPAPVKGPKLFKFDHDNNLLFRDENDLNEVVDTVVVKLDEQLNLLWMMTIPFNVLDIQELDDFTLIVATNKGELKFDSKTGNYKEFLTPALYSQTPFDYIDGWGNGYQNVITVAHGAVGFNLNKYPLASKKPKFSIPLGSYADGKAAPIVVKGSTLYYVFKGILHKVKMNK
ncbi:hypothetical protein FD13_GL001455 [Levilactobacillus senmaizukei DSM 21775 = NBRC 103853]|uniref:Uncharacterized protein n=1 Tax=Levilactobacillus senmaizukei DSM 21775 = NBRC 103853 TaxID=1423803 RepID=A0A0R2DB37_9LACO|nr:hypothetical protein [Levilactobacillus senmaizukei]KRN01054.1 hypothetical protein FD13_GL001455 [Levilactobacillus senmaizukei DSM 21775 = NBRC 103853]